jgi:4-diphosphocytidyl-2-C-methyl-D-erythritol kinase
VTAVPDVHVRVPAKINLALSVGPPGADGFHELATVFQAVSLYDDLVASPADDVTIEVTGTDAARVPADERNLAVRAARLLAARAGVSEGVALRVTKRIPVAGGMAGGSADAAAALLALDRLWDARTPDDELLAMAAELGSDVPFALLGGTAVGRGRGEEVAPALARGTYHWVLAFGHHGLATPAVYRRFDQLSPHPPAPEIPADLMNALRSGDAKLLGAALVNDLQPAALDLQPRLKLVLEAGLEYGALGALVSGSGPTCAFLVDSESAAVDLSVALSADGLCRAVRRATGPVFGARVIG